jgi:SAV_6107-like HEPN
MSASVRAPVAASERSQAPTARLRGPAAPRPLPRRSAALDLLTAARRGLAEASSATLPTERYAAAHLSALRCAAAVLAARARPDDRAVRSRPRSAWALLPSVAPELTEWAAFFSAGASKRAAAEAGLSRAVRSREADDLLRDAQTFLALVETTLGLPHQQALPIDEIDPRSHSSTRPVVRLLRGPRPS